MLALGSPGQWVTTKYKVWQCSFFLEDSPFAIYYVFLQIYYFKHDSIKNLYYLMFEEVQFQFDIKVSDLSSFTNVRWNLEMYQLNDSSRSILNLLIHLSICLLWYIKSIGLYFWLFFTLLAAFRNENRLTYKLGLDHQRAETPITPKKLI